MRIVLSVFLTVDSVAVRERVEHPTDEAEEMASYDRDKKYYSECSDAFSSWFHDGGSSRNKQVNTSDRWLILCQNIDNLWQVVVSMPAYLMPPNCPMWCVYVLNILLGVSQLYTCKNEF